MTKQKIAEIIIILLIVIGALGVRLYKIDNPIADWHSWRQADTAAVARNFYQDGYNPFYPQGDDLTPISDNGMINVHRYRFVEFPIYSSIIYLGYLINNGVDERIARFVAALFSLGSLIFVYHITKRYFGKTTGYLAATFYAFLPYNIYFSRVVLPEASLVFFSLGMFYFWDLWIERKSYTKLIISGIFTALALLTKPQAVFYLIPLIYLYYQRYGRIFPTQKMFWVVGILSVLPFIGWRLWISQYPEGIPSASWLLNGDGIRFKPIFWKWILNDRLGREILSVSGSILLFTGLLIKPLKQQTWTLHLLTLASFLFLVVFATGNVRHDYYQYFIIPALVMMTARGVTMLWQGLPFILPRAVTIPLSLLLVIMMFYSSWNEVKGLYQINNWSIVEGGRIADQVLPKDAVVLAAYQGDSAFLYQVNRSGFAWEIIPLKELVEQFGVTAVVSVTKDAKTRWAQRHYMTLKETDQVVVVDLTQPLKNVPGNDPEPQ